MNSWEPLSPYEWVALIVAVVFVLVTIHAAGRVVSAVFRRDDRRTIREHRERMEALR